MEGTDFFGSLPGDDGGGRGVWLRQFLGQGQEREDDGFFALPIDFPRLLLGERRSEGNGRGKGLVRHHVGSVGQSQDQYEPEGPSKNNVQLQSQAYPSYAGWSEAKLEAVLGWPLRIQKQGGCPLQSAKKLHRLQPRSHHSPRPLVPEIPRPRRAAILPEPLEVFA